MIELRIGSTLFPCDEAPRSIASPLGLGNLRKKSMKLFVLDPHTIYRRGLAASLEPLAEVDSVAHAESVREAWEHPGLFGADLVILDPSASGGGDFIGAVRESTGAQVIVCSSKVDEDSVRSAMSAGAVGYLRKDTLTTEGLAAAVKAVANDTGVMTPELLGTLLRSISSDDIGAARPAAARLTDREQQVLALIAAGHPTREVAKQLCYSERTVKNVLHDVVTKLNARSRSQAVAFAVREGLI
jgi:DNA-binding NarL/FixJ family response regulator